MKKIISSYSTSSDFGNDQAKSQIITTLNAIRKSGVRALIILPNNDAGFSKIITELKSSKISYVESLTIDEYINLLKRSIGLIGNSSRIHETATFNIPTINIGTDKGRLRTKNVIDVDYDEDQISKAINKCIRNRYKDIKYENPYGDGNSSPKIIDLIKKIDLSNKVIQKKITY